MPLAVFVAGAPGSGKSTLMPVAEFGVDAFNADDQAAALNQGSYVSIPHHIRHTVNLRLEQFISEHISRRVSFAVETTLRSTIALDQASAARQAGFYVTMVFVCTASPEINLQRVAKRALGGGHSAPVATLLGIRARSYANLSVAICRVGTALDELDVFDNSEEGRLMKRAFRLCVTTDDRLTLERSDTPQFLVPYLLEAMARSR